MTAQSDAQHRLVLHGAIILLVGFLSGYVAVFEEVSRSGHAWQAGHAALLLTGVWLMATAAVLPLLELPRREAKALLVSLTGGAYSFMAAVLIQAATGVRAISPDVRGISLVAFAANLLAVLGTTLAASLTILGAWNGLRAARREARTDPLAPTPSLAPGE
jgi:cytochrome c oxidase assembly factor CtaG